MYKTSYDNTVCIVIPIYKKQLNDYEIISLNRCFEILNKYKIYLICPENLDMSWYFNKYSNFEVKRFSDKHFKNIKSYNKIMLSSSFYEKFNEYDYMLIYQTDAFVFQDNLMKFCNFKYDYIGAPWINGLFSRTLNFKGSSKLGKIFSSVNKSQKYYVGNGGLSLRNTKAFIALLKSKKIYSMLWNRNEDVFFSVCGEKWNKDFKVAPIKVALGFSFEKTPRRCIELNNNELPFGCHAWGKYDLSFIRNVFNKFGYKI